MKKRFTEAQIVGFLREADAGIPVKDLCRKHGFSDGSYYLWRSKFGGMSVSDAKRLKELETENGRLKTAVGRLAAGKRGHPRGPAKKMVTAPVRREVVRAMVTRGLSERRALTVVRMSASSLRYVPAPDRNAALRARIVALAHRHRRYGAGMIYLKLRQAGVRRQSQARRSALRGGPAPGETPATEEGAAGRSPAARPAAGAQRGVVGGLRVRSHGRGPRAEVPDHRR